MTDTVTDFITLFRGRGDAFGAVHGESIQRALGIDDWTEHLYGEGSLGIYPLAPREQAEPNPTQLEAQYADTLKGSTMGQWWCGWGCTDIDIGYDEGWPLALNLRTALAALGVTAWIERTKGKGWHVWVFAEHWVPALVMRRALLAAHQLADVPTTEVNPKQVDPSKLKVGLGNYVNLPYSRLYAETGKRVVIGPDLNEFGGECSLSWFVEHAMASRASFPTLLSAARLWTPPPPPRRVDIDPNYNVDLHELAAMLGGLAYTIFTKGPLEANDGKPGRDRSGTLQRLAHLCAEGGLQPPETLAIITDADRRWGKFSERSDGEQQLAKMTTAAHGKERPDG